MFEQAFDILKAELQHPFFMVVAAVFFFTGIKYLASGEKWRLFWLSHKAEFRTVMGMGWCLVIWDEEMINAFYQVLHYVDYHMDWLDTGVADPTDHREIFQTHYYFIFPFSVELMVWIYQEFKKKIKKSQ